MNAQSPSSPPVQASTYARPKTRLKTKPIRPRPLAPIRPPTSNSKIVLDDQWVQANPEYQFLPSWTRSTHVVPSAAPRSFSYGTREAFVDGESKPERRAKAAAVVRSLVAKKAAHERDETVQGRVPEGNQPTLVNVLDRYIRQNAPEGSPKNGVTLILAHANGFPRRIWEPAIRALLELQEDPFYSGSRVDEVWSFEAVNHGDSALLNEDKLGDLFDWLDYSRDVLNFLLHYLPSEFRRKLPTVLPPVSEADSRARLSKGIPGRRIVGAGHSIGGCALSRAAMDSIPLWSSLILVDPILIPPLDVDPSGGMLKPLSGAVSRRTRWPSKDEARIAFLRAPFFQAWDPQVLEAYIQEGICDDSVHGGVRLKQSGFQEACSFAERRAIFETWDLLENLNPRVRLFWLMSGKQPILTGPEDIVKYTVWRRPAQCSNIRMAGAGHLIVHEAPADLAQAIIGFLSEEIYLPEKSPSYNVHGVLRTDSDTRSNTKSHVLTFRFELFSVLQLRHP